MSHPNDDQLLLYSYAELPAGEASIVAQHLTQCGECRARFVTLEESRVAVEMAAAKPVRGRRRLAWLSLPIAAAIGALLLARQPGDPGEGRPLWQSHTVASPTAGYVTGGAAFIAIDSQLTLLEQRSLP